MLMNEGWVAVREGVLTQFVVYVLLNIHSNILIFLQDRFSNDSAGQVSRLIFQGSIRLTNALECWQKKGSQPPSNVYLIDSQ